jgi:hypothetical protein
MASFFLSSRSKDAPLRTLDVKSDDSDARDYIFQPSLSLLPRTVDHRGYAPVLDQLTEGACVGFALATVINVSLNLRGRNISTKQRRKKADQVSPRMLYEMARRYDEWKGEDYEGTSLRGAMKGWHKHGVTTEKSWPYFVNGKLNRDRELTPDRARDALSRPIGAYYRIVDADVSHVQAAVVEGDAVLASSWVHPGWQNENLEPPRRGNPKAISPKTRNTGLHAFAIVGYTVDGFIIQNSWGGDWGSEGYALLAYEDWFENRQDAWVARPGPETRDSHGTPKIFVVGFSGGESKTRAGTAAQGLEIDPQVLPYIINTGDKGGLSSGGLLATKEEELPSMAQRVLTTPVLQDGNRHVILYAHGGLNSEGSSAETANRLWSVASSNNVRAYFFVWQSGIDESIIGWLKSDDDVTGPTGFSWQDAWEKIKKGTGAIVREAQKKLGAGLAPVAREVFWDEMKGRSQGASTAKGGAALFAKQLFAAMSLTPNQKYKIHLVGHSAGSIYLGWLYESVLATLFGNTANVQLASIQFMAPALTVKRATEAFLANGNSAVPKDRFVIYMLKPQDEENDTIHIYPSSLLTYVADHLEDANGRVPILGIREDFEAAQMNFATPVAATESVRHGEFDDEGHEVETIFTQIGKAQF